MFEGSLIESRGLTITKTQQWTTVGSLTLQCALAGLLLAFPLMRPQPLPTIIDAPTLSVPLLRKPVQQTAQRTAVTNTSSAFTAPATASAVASSMRPFIFLESSGSSNDPAPSLDHNLSMTQGPAGMESVIGIANGPGITVVRARPSSPVRISSGVSKGLLLTPIQPVYPPLARATRVQGEVVLEAVISQAGRIESLHVISGPPMLRDAALTAVQSARYRPYLLNGEPVEVNTTITVIFQLGS